MPRIPVTPFNRRSFGRAAVAGGVGALIFSKAVHSQPPSSADVIDARKAGAAGDGKADDTAALQRALDKAGETASAVFVPPGIYLTRELHVRAGVCLTGYAGWNCQTGGGSVLRLLGADSSCLLDLTEARGATIHGLTLEGGTLGQGIHGIATKRTGYGKHEDSFRIDTCQVIRFSGSGMNLLKVWAFSVRHCYMKANQGDGLTLNGWDGYILDNWFSGNTRAGFAAREQNASITFTANRIEWNGEENMLVAGGDGYQITGNFFDRAGTVGLALRSGRGGCNQFSINGNFFKRSGKHANASTHDSVQVLLEGAEGVTFTGNTLQAGRDDHGKGVWSPSFGIVYGQLKNCVIANNVLHDGALRELLVDLGQNGDGVVVKDNPGRLKTIVP